MSFDRNLLLKWVAADAQSASTIDFRLVDHCILIGFSDERVVRGFTVFEPRNIDAEFAARLQKRIQNNLETISDYLLIVPSAHKHKVESLITKSPYIKIEFSSFFAVKWVSDRFVYRSRLKIVNVDDSPVILKILKNLLEDNNFCDVVAQISKPTEAVEAIKKIKPDIVTMDMQMPIMNGAQVTKDLLDVMSLPIIIVSALDFEDGSLVFEALQNGAFDYIQKPKTDDRSAFAEELKSKILAASVGKDIKSVKRNGALVKRADSFEFNKDLIWLIGASTGGTQALTQVLTSLPSRIPPLLIVQHIPPVFSKYFAESLAKLCPFEVKEAANGESIKANTVYIAPGGLQMGIINAGFELKIEISDAAPVNRFKPSVDFMFHSVAKQLSGKKGFKIIAGILTGMGSDGAVALKELRDSGAITFAQDEATSVVYGMPRAAQEIGAVMSVCSLPMVSQYLVKQSLVKKSA